MKRLYQIVQGLICIYAIVISAIHFTEKSPSKFDFESWKQKYEADFQKKIDSLKLAEVTIERSKQITDSLADRYVAVHPIKEIDLLPVPMANETITITRRELMVYQNALLRVELNDRMINEIPEIVKRESEKAHKHGLKKGLAIGLPVGVIAGGIIAKLFGL